LVIVAIEIREQKAIWWDVLGHRMAVHRQLQRSPVQSKRDILIRAGIVQIPVPVKVHGEPNRIRSCHADAGPSSAGGIIACHGKQLCHHFHAGSNIFLRVSNLGVSMVVLFV
jgi:hypothetical protein